VSSDFELALYFIIVIHSHWWCHQHFT